MSENDFSNANGGLAIGNVILSSSIVLAAITGVFYLLGGATGQGRAWALGLDYLSGLQPNEYIFAGAEVILNLLSDPIGLGVALIIAVVLLFGVQWIGSQADRSHPFFLILVAILTIGLLTVILCTANISHSLLTNAFWPIGRHEAVLFSFIALCFCAVPVGSSFRLFSSKLWRVRSVFWSGALSILCLFNLGGHVAQRSSTIPLLLRY